MTPASAPPMFVQRRRLLRGALAAAAAGVAAARPAATRAAPRGFPFTLGVASGAPLADGFVLWTRLLPEEFDPQALPGHDLPVAWEVAEDDAFRRVVRTGDALALASRAHAVHMDVRGLAPDRPYWYRFFSGGHASPVGRSRTLPSPAARTRALRFAFASCVRLHKSGTDLNELTHCFKISSSHFRNAIRTLDDCAK